MEPVMEPLYKAFKYGVFIVAAVSDCTC